MASWGSPSLTLRNKESILIKIRRYFYIGGKKMALVKCSECGKEISDQAVSCPHCGCPIIREQDHEAANEKQVNSSLDAVNGSNKRTHKKAIFIIAGCVLVALIAVLIGVMFIYQGSFDVTLSSDTIELGSEKNLVDYLEYEPEDITEVNVISDGGFNADQIGEYSVLFSVKNAKGRVKEIPFELRVVDTAAPELSIVDDIVYIPKGSEYDPESNIKVVDKDDYTIEITGDYNLSEAGTYNISAVATDNSGNVSEKKSMQLIVEDRDKCVVRNIQMGDSKDVIKRYETGEFLQDETNADGSSFLVYSDAVEGEDAYIFYLMNSKDELYSIMIYFVENHTDHSLYISCFDRIAEKLSNIYGEANVEKGTGSLYNYCESEAEALNIGQVKYRDTWESEDMSIILYLGKDNYEVTFVLSYESKIIEKPDDSGIN